MSSALPGRMVNAMHIVKTADAPETSARLVLARSAPAVRDSVDVGALFAYLSKENSAPIAIAAMKPVVCSAEQ